MFDFGFWEIAIIGMITLIVVGPSRMPSLARKAGLYFGKFNNFLNKVKKDINDELKIEELKEDININDQKKDLLNTLKDDE